MSVCEGASPEKLGLGLKAPNPVLIVDLQQEMSQCQQALQGGVHVASLHHVREP